MKNKASYKRVNVSLPPVLLKEIDEICEYNWLSRSEFIRKAIRQYLQSLDDREEKEEC